MKKIQEKKLHLGKVKIADLSKSKKQSGRICVTSIDDTSCTTSSVQLSRCFC